MEHVGMRQTGFYIGAPQPLVEKHTGGIALYQFAHGLREQGGPSLGFAV
jgi:hypothetical protein